MLLDGPLGPAQRSIQLQAPATADFTSTTVAPQSHRVSIPSERRCGMFIFKLMPWLGIHSCSTSLIPITSLTDVNLPLPPKHRIPLLPAMLAHGPPTTFPGNTPEKVPHGILHDTCSNAPFHPLMRWKDPQPSPESCKCSCTAGFASSAYQSLSVEPETTATAKAQASLSRSLTTRTRVPLRSLARGWVLRC